LFLAGVKVDAAELGNRNRESAVSRIGGCPHLKCFSFEVTAVKMKIKNNMFM
jgi:hypothetical protein